MANSDNPRLGLEFERTAKSEFAEFGIPLQKDFSVDVGISSKKKPHKFDLGSSSPPVLVECKRHTWTEGGNTPSAKLTIWNEAMYYFAVAPNGYRKILYVLRSLRGGESLADHYIKRFEHLIPDDVEIWEYDSQDNASTKMFPRSAAA
ncbi:MAG: hypothetical protein IIA89_14700 [Chloroflexi bacterium]|nr:hypothetical protein [Chloroflexota bacterium]